LPSSRADDRGVLGAAKVGERSAGDTHHANDVDVEKPVPLLVAVVLDRAAGTGPGVVDEDVQHGHCRAEGPELTRRRQADAKGTTRDEGFETGKRATVHLLFHLQQSAPGAIMPGPESLSDVGGAGWYAPRVIKRLCTRAFLALPEQRCHAHRLGYDATVAYDKGLADRIRELVAGEAGVSEKKMFGGLAFLVGGNMAIAASAQGGLLVRVGPGSSAKLVASTNATVAAMQGRLIPGWLRVSGEHVASRSELAKWAKIGVAYARSLPTKG